MTKQYRCYYLKDGVERWFDEGWGPLPDILHTDVEASSMQWRDKPIPEPMTLPTNLDTTLTERNSRYGDFLGHSEVTQALKEVVSSALLSRQKVLDPDQKEALEMIFHKIGRIVNGDPDYADSWHDIAGYARLVEDRLNGVVR